MHRVLYSRTPVNLVELAVSNGAHVFQCCFLLPAVWCVHELLYIRISSAESFKFSRDQRRKQPTTLGLELNSQRLRNLALLPESGVRHQGTTLVGARTLVLGPDLKGSLLATDHCGLFCTKYCPSSPPSLLLFSIAGTSAACLSALLEHTPESLRSKNSPTALFLCLPQGVEITT